jgi:hypothetical protein
MKSLIVTNTHKNRGEVVEIQFTDQKYYYSDEQGRLYTTNDFVDTDSIDHEQAKAEKLIEYWTVVSQTIQEFREKEAVHD